MMKQIEIYLKEKLVHAGTIKSGSQFLNFDLRPYIKYNIKLDNKIKYRILYNGKELPKRDLEYIRRKQQIELNEIIEIYDSQYQITNIEEINKNTVLVEVHKHNGKRFVYTFKDIPKYYALETRLYRDERK